MTRHPLAIIAYKLAIEALAIATIGTAIFVGVEVVLPGLLSSHVSLFAILATVLGIAGIASATGVAIGATAAPATQRPTRRVAVGLAVALTLLLAVDFARQLTLPNTLVLLVAAVLWFVAIETILTDGGDA